MTASELLAAFCEGQGDAIATEHAEPLGRALGDALALARAAWPAVHVDPETWMRALAEVAPLPRPVETPFGELAITDLYLAHACATGDTPALVTCDALLVREAGYAASAARIDTSLRDEAVQIVRTVAFSPRPERPAAIHDYAGRASLSGWLRVLVAREMVKLSKAQQRSVPLEEHLLDIVGVEQDPMLEELKTRYRAELANAFRAALDELTARDRMLMRYQLVDGLTIDDIGKLHRVHRATAARWLAGIRDGLVERTRAMLATALGVDTIEAASIVRMVQSQLDVSVIRHLQPKGRSR